MKSLGLNEIREVYQAFFESKNHLRLKSASLIPQNDKSLLLIAAGMAPLKPYFTGKEIPPSPRAVSCQKCVRTNDIENVGVTSRHCTFFEMLGNFSFGDYFKKEAITWAWEFLTEVLEIPAEKLYPTVYLEDDEAYGIWRDMVGIPESRLTRLGKDDNFWEHGQGPCGPDSEIFFDFGPEKGCGKPDCKPGCDCDRFVEVWNLVFTQFNKEEDGSYTPLAQKNIDTGMGLERIAAVLQQADSVTDLDTIKVIRDRVCQIAGVTYGASQKADKSVKIITDHTRAVVFMLSDGIMPSNEGRGYVLRRLLRRAARHGKLLGVDGLFLTETAKAAVDVSKGAYPELNEKADYIYNLINIEEKRFHETLDQGLEVLRKFLAASKDSLTSEMLGKQTFILYDTFGFPPELTAEILADENVDVTIDMDAYDAEMERQRVRARSAREETNFMGAEETAVTKLPPDMSTTFVGYDRYTAKGRILAMVADNEQIESVGLGKHVAVVTDVTPLFAESGGQKGDSGVIETIRGIIRVTDCQRVMGNKSVHYGVVGSGTVSVGDEAVITVDYSRRTDTARNHTATHLLHKALRDVLGSHVQQAGSMVAADRLRFDFTHFQPLTKTELEAVESIVNSQILMGLEVSTIETTPDKARDMGAMALFGEKYGQTVRVVDIGGWSMELCGGTHLNNTGRIGTLKILSETGIAAGVRRIEAVTGKQALSLYKEIQDKWAEAAALLKCPADNLINKINSILAEKNELQKTLASYASKSADGLVTELYNGRTEIGGVSLIAADAKDADTDGLRNLSDKLRDKLGASPGVVLLYGAANGKGTLLATATDAAVKMGVHCGNIIKETAKTYGGGGGGKPSMAQAGIPGAVAADQVLATAKSQLG